MKSATDRNGVSVHVGTRVRVVSLRPSVLARMPATERKRLNSMLGEVLPVEEIDEYGSAWVTKWWQHRGGKSTSHSLALTAQEMEVVADANANAA